MDTGMAPMIRSMPARNVQVEEADERLSRSDHYGGNLQWIQLYVATTSATWECHTTGKSLRMIKGPDGDTVYVSVDLTLEAYGGEGFPMCFPKPHATIC